MFDKRKSRCGNSDSAINSHKLINYILVDWKGKIKMKRLYKSDFVFGMMMASATATVISSYTSCEKTLFYGILTVICVFILARFENE